MRERGPSPLVPSLLLAALALFIGGSIIRSFLEACLSVVNILAEGGAILALLIILLLLLLLLLQFLSLFFPSLEVSSLVASRYSGSSGHDAEGLGFGILLMIFLFIVLCYLW